MTTLLLLSGQKAHYIGKKYYKVSIAKLTIFVLLLVFFFFSSCSNDFLSFEIMNIPIYIPKIPEIWADAQLWEIVVYSSTGYYYKMITKGECTVSLPLPRKGSSSILCYACVVQDEKIMVKTKPYGALWPIDKDGEEIIKVNCISGYVAYIYELFLKNNTYCQGNVNQFGNNCFDYNKFSMSIYDKVNDIWLIEPQKIIPFISSGVFRIDYVKVPQIVEVIIPEQLEKMYPESPFAKVIDFKNNETKIEIPLGQITRYFNKNCELTVLFTEDGQLNYTIRKW